jgi:hypothetical protein
MDRLIASLALGKVATHSYTNLAWGRATAKVPATDLSGFILALASIPDGVSVAVHILQMQFFGDKQDKSDHAPELIAAGRKILTLVKFNRRSQRNELDLDGVVEACLRGDEGYAAAKVICENLKQAILARDTYGFDHNHLLKSLFQVQAEAVLDALFVGDERAVRLGLRILEDASNSQQNPIDQVSDATLLDWCERDPAARFPLIASAVSVSAVSADDDSGRWTSRASLLVHKAPNPVAVIRAIAGRFRPSHWSGSLSTILELKAKLLEQFDTQGNPDLAAFIETEKTNLLKEAAAEREWETKHDKGRDERFE